MKKSSFVFTGLLIATFFLACNNETDTDKATATNTSEGSASDISNEAGNVNDSTSAAGATGATNMNNQTPLSAADSTFVMKAAAGNMFEVEVGNYAQQNAQAERVKMYGAMMVQDHQAANQELTQAVAGRNMNLPTALPADKQKTLDQLRSLKGKAFDNRYMSLMVDDHQKTIADFQKQANGGTNDNIKAYAQRTLPALQKHLDSATTINRAIK